MRLGWAGMVLLIWALRPNIQRLKEGTERLHGFRAEQKKGLLKAEK